MGRMGVQDRKRFHRSGQGLWSLNLIRRVRSGYLLAMGLTAMFAIEAGIAQWTRVVRIPAGNEGLDHFMITLFRYMKDAPGVILILCGIVWLVLTTVAIGWPTRAKRYFQLLQWILIPFHSTVILWIVGPLRRGPDVIL
jgi:hypothetical protein